MPWDRKDNPWIRKQRRLCWSATLGTTGLAIIILGSGLWLIWRTQVITSGIPGSLGWTIRFSLLAPLAFQVIFIAFCVRQLIREWRVYRRVPLHDAMVCPRCRRVMNAVDNSTVRCPKGHSTWPREELVHYWEQYGLARKASWRMLAEMRRVHEHRRFDLFGRYQAWAWRRPVLATIFAPLTVTVVASVLWILVFGGTVLQVIRVAPFILFFGVGGMCLGFGIKQRRGNEMYCAACDYEREPSQSGLNSRCPECGAAWNEPGATVRGTESSKPMLATVGIVLVISMMGFLQLQNTSMLSTWLARAAPTSLLISSLGHSTLASDEDWAELSRRSLTDEQRQRLVELLLDQQRRTSYFEATDGAKWLEDAVYYKEVTQDIGDRYFAQSLKLWLDGPGRTKVGQEVRISVEGKHRLSGQSWWYVEAALAGFGVDDGDTTEQREHKWRNGINLDSTLREFMPEQARGRRPQDEAPALTVQFDTPGRHVIHYSAWIVVRPSMSSASSNKGTRNLWLPDGTPDVPPDAVYVQKVELEHPIVVSPR